MVNFLIGKIKYILFLLLYLISNFIYSQSPCETRDRNALIALYNATNGANWINNTNWNTAAPLNTWHGVSTNANGCVTIVDLNLTNTNAGNNNLIGILPTEIGDLLNLEILDLSDQNIMGSLPNSIGDLQNLLWLQLDNNDMSGTLPVTIGTLNNLEYLSLSSNQFSGTLPSEIGDLNALKYLIADHNEFSGNLPQSLGNLVNLEALWLFENELSGLLPISFSNLGNLEQILLSDNMLSGVIPDFWGNLTNMEALWLGDNQFVGQIPNSISSMASLRQLHLQNNLLTGIIPAHLENLISLRSLYLGDNNFSGIIPVELGNITRLEELLIYRTQVSGTIPSELGNLTNLTHLWLAYNNLTGEIPNTLSNLLSLEQLALEDNFLSGTIPQNLNQLSNIMALSVENNLLEGPIPDFSGTPLNTFYFKNNQFQFGDFENQFNYYYNNLSIFEDNPQAKIDIVQTLNQNIGSSVTLTTDASGNQNHYQWYKNGVLIEGAPDSPNFILTNLQPEDIGIYHATVTSDIVTDLILVRNDILLIVECLTPPTADELPDIVECESFILPMLSLNNSYYTEPNAGGNQIYAGDSISKSQTIYVFTGNVNLGCFAESNFIVIIDNFLQVDSMDDISECESYILPSLKAGNYFTQSNGAGKELFSGDVLVTSQIIYVYVQSGSCSDEKSFILEINPSECEVTLDDDKIVFPKFFTPNNDGFNDLWRRLNITDDIQGNVYVFDRYGKLLKQMNALDGQWDGTYNGHDMPSTDYWYRFVHSETGNIISGHFTLKR